MISGFEKGKWYRYTVKHTSTPAGWNDKMMDVCDGNPCYCIYGDEHGHAEFANHEHYDDELSDEQIISGASTRGWWWSPPSARSLAGLANWEEVNSPLLYSVSLFSGSTTISYPETSEIDLPNRSDLRAELLRNI